MYILQKPANRYSNYKNCIAVLEYRFNNRAAVRIGKKCRV